MSSPAVRAGVAYGIINAIIGAIGMAINVAVVSQTPGRASGETVDQYIQRIAGYVLILGAVGIVLLIINLVFYLLAGRSAAARTGSVGLGALGGLLTAVISGIIGLAIGIGISAAGVYNTLETSVATGSGATGPAATGIAATVTSGIIDIIIGAAIGAGIGALGGLIGRGTYQKANPMGAPMGMPGAYPPPPGFPNQPMQ